MKNGLLYWFLLSGITVLLSLLALVKYSHSHENLPVGCDEFGYLQLANDLVNKSHSGSEFSHLELAEYLKSQGMMYPEYAWMIAPHAYHYYEETGEVINQYPPGTSFLLVSLPQNQRKQAFPFIVAFFAILIPIGGFWVLKDDSISHPVYLIVLIVLSFYVPVTGMEFGRINSVAPTFGLLLAAGIALQKRPEFAVFLISISLLFRVANLVVLVTASGLLTLYILNSNRKNKGLELTKLLVVILPGVLGVMIYQFIVLGNPFATTYSNIDQKWVENAEGIWQNLQFYLVENPGWFLVHLVGFALLYFLFRKGFVQKWILWFMVVMTAVNYGFYLFHFIAIPYYPYATGVLLFGIILANLPLLRVFERAWLRVAGGMFGLLVVLAVFLFRPAVNNQNEQIAAYLECFSDGQVVWSELHSGTVEYASEAIGFRYLWGTERARKAAVKRMHQQGKKQVFWIDEIPDKKGEITEMLRELKLSYTLETCALGELIVVE